MRLAGRPPERLAQFALGLIEHAAARRRETLTRPVDFEIQHRLRSAFLELTALLRRMAEPA